MCCKTRYCNVVCDEQPANATTIHPTNCRLKYVEVSSFFALVVSAHASQDDESGMGVAWALLIILVVFLLIALVPSTCTSVCCLHLMVVVFKPVLNFSLMSVLMHVHPGYRGLLRRQRTYGETSSAQSPVTHCFHLRITSTLLSLLKLHQFCR
jgi:cobalamin biosynthesis protein CobD/CbiB